MATIDDGKARHHVLDAKPNELLHGVLDDVVLHAEKHFGGLQHKLAIIPFRQF